MNTNWNALIKEHEIAYLRDDLATSSPESYSIEEMKAISDGMFESTAKVESAMREDFAAMPRFARELMLELLGASDCETRSWWEEVLGTSEKPIA